MALLEDVNSIAAETDCQAGFISKGISMACFYYARCLHEGRGVQKDEVASKSFYTKVRQLFIAFVTTPSPNQKSGGTHPTGILSCLYTISSHSLQNALLFHISFQSCKFDREMCARLQDSVQKGEI